MNKRNCDRCGRSTLRIATPAGRMAFDVTPVRRSTPEDKLYTVHQGVAIENTMAARGLQLHQETCHD